MPYNLRNRSFLSLLDFSKRDLNYILNLARAARFDGLRRLVPPTG